MKLLQRTNRNYLAYSLLVISLIGSLLVVVMNRITRNETDEQLLAQLNTVRSSLQENPEKLCFAPQVQVRILPYPAISNPVFSDSLMTTQPENDLETSRVITACYTINQVGYAIRISNPMIQASEFFGLLLITVIIAMILLVTGLILLNRRISHQTWKPFGQYLDVLQTFTFDHPSKIDLINSDIDEFSELRDVLLRFTGKAQSDFLSLKEFTENASHEMQTPLAIIQTRVDSLVQGVTLSQDQAEHLGVIQQSLQRLNRLNQALVLLTRIENKQFSESVRIDPATVIRRQMDPLSDLFDSRGLTVQYLLSPNIFVQANAQLFEIVISNLLNNCLKHALTNTEVVITLDQTFMSFQNSGNPVTFEPELFFDRFRKGTSSTGSLGLGLTLVKKICDLSGWKVSYKIEGGLHNITVRF